MLFVSLTRVCLRMGGEREGAPRGLEGCFAQGHVYVLISRVTDPATQR